MATQARKRIGKAQAREEFSSLIEAVARGSGAVEITDYGKIAAVLLSEREYEWLRACAKKTGVPQRNAWGILQLADNRVLEDAEREIRADFEKSIRRTASLL